MIPDNELARGIQSKSFRALGPVPPVGYVEGETPQEPGVLGGWSLLNIIFFTEFVQVPNLPENPQTSSWHKKQLFFTRKSPNFPET